MGLREGELPVSGDVPPGEVSELTGVIPEVGVL